MSRIKFVLLLVVASFSLTSFAAFNPTIAVTSFQRLGSSDGTLAELCGTVQENDNSEIHLNVLADPTSINPHHYHTLTGNDGRFCIILSTISGLARVSLISALDDRGVAAKIR